ncbi:MAG: cation:proton antiporter, partial [Candidatus Brocadia sp.]
QPSRGQKLSIEKSSRRAKTIRKKRGSLTDKASQSVVPMDEIPSAVEKGDTHSNALAQDLSATDEHPLIAEEKEIFPILSTSKQPISIPTEEPSISADDSASQLSTTDNEQLSLTQEANTPLPSNALERKYHQEEAAKQAAKKAEKHILNIWHSDPTHDVILAIIVTLIAAKAGELIVRKIKLPGVVGNMLIGMVLGNICVFTGWDFFNFLRTMPFLKMISYFGTLVLLFTAGLHTDIRALLKVGVSSFLVCIGGIIVPAWLGLVVGYFLLPDVSIGVKVLLAIILCNTGMGLLTAVLRELKALNTPEGRILIGAAVLTEIIVILTFGLVSGFVVRGIASVPHILVNVGIVISFVVIVFLVILKYSERFGNFLTKRVTEGLNLPIVIILSLILAFIFGSMGLHTVIGAFVAGLFLRNVKIRYSDDTDHKNVDRVIHPFYAVLVPILFVRVGAQVELESFLNMSAIFFGLVITGAAVVGKMFCGVYLAEKSINRLAIGIGMTMKLEGTLILSGICRDMGILNATVFSSIIMVIVLTSTICPSLLKLSLTKKFIHSKGMNTYTEKKELEQAFK